MSKRKYTAPCDKIKQYSVKYGITEKYAKYIMTEHEDLLTFDELKIKYDCPTLGKLPDWLGQTIDEKNEALHTTIIRAVNKKYTTSLNLWTSKEDLYMYLQELIRKRIHRISSLGELYVTCINALNSHIVRHNMECLYITDRLEQQAIKDKPDTQLMQILPNKRVSDEDEKFLFEIKSIKDKSIKNFLIVTGYLVAQVDALRADYMLLKLQLPESQQISLNELETKCDRYIRKKEFTGTLPKIIKPTARDVIKALELNTYKTSKGRVITTSVVAKLQEYRNTLISYGVM